MSVRCLISIISIAIIMVGPACQEKERLTRDRVAISLDTAETRLHWLDYRLAQQNWEFITTGSTDSLEFYRQLHDNYYATTNAFEILRDGAELLSDDEIAARRLDLVLRALKRGRIEAVPTVATLRDSLMAALHTRPVRLGAESTTLLQAERVLKSADDPTRRELAYRARYAIEEDLADQIARLLRLRNSEARRLGYNDYFTMCYASDGPGLNEYQQLLTELESASDQAYQSILDRQGNVRLESWDLVHAIAEPVRSILEQPVADSQWQMVSTFFEEVGFDLDKLPIFADLQTLPDQPTGVSPFVVNAPHDLRLVANLGSGWNTTESLTSALGRLLFVSQINQTESAFSNFLDDAWSEGIAVIFASMISEPTRLGGYFNLSPVQVQAVALAQQELSMVRLRQLLLKLNFEYEAYRSGKPDLNQLYWDLYERIMRLPRHEDINAWAADPELIGNPVYGHNYLFGLIIARQTLSCLRTTNDGLIGGPGARSFLVQNYFRFGARYPWPELLERGTNEAFNPKYLVE